MDEPTLRGLIDQVKCGHLSRRLFLQAEVTVPEQVNAYVV